MIHQLIYILLQREPLTFFWCFYAHRYLFVLQLRQDILSGKYVPLWSQSLNHSTLGHVHLTPLYTHYRHYLHLHFYLLLIFSHIMLYTVLLTQLMAISSQQHVSLAQNKDTKQRGTRLSPRLTKPSRQFHGNLITTITPGRYCPCTSYCAIFRPPFVYSLNKLYKC